jgi:ABC-type multidrug transport system ATPase subunit
MTPLSAVDTETDLAIRQNLKELEKDTTTLIITHRVSTARDADLIVVLEDGKVAEMGKHEELVKKPAPLPKDRRDPRQDGLERRNSMSSEEMEEEEAAEQTESPDLVPRIGRYALKNGRF